ncbi:MAG: flagellar FlbD family protein [Phycisphaerales bacterium]|nr:flagellar FlbD family protein [Phycisphaerales bacterium]
MISVTRLNGQKFVLNAELIRTIEESPDTIITLISGEHLVVAESSDEIIRRVIDFERHLRRLSSPA